MGEVVLLNVLGSSPDCVLENIAHGDLFRAEKQRRNREDSAAAAEVEHLVAGLHDFLEGFHDQLGGVVLSCAEGGSRVYLKDTVAGHRSYILPGRLDHQGLTNAERLVVLLPVVCPVLLLDVGKLHAQVAVVTLGVGLLPALNKGAYCRECFRALGVVVDINGDVRLLTAQSHQFVVNVVPVGVLVRKEAFEIRAVADDKAGYAVILERAGDSVDSL